MLADTTSSRPIRSSRTRAGVRQLPDSFAGACRGTDLARRPIAPLRPRRPIRWRASASQIESIELSTCLPRSSTITRDVVVLYHVHKVDRALLYTEHDPIAAADTSLEVVPIRQDRLHVEPSGVDPLDEGENHPVA